MDQHGAQLKDADWRRATRSQQQGQCVEVALLGVEVTPRD